MEREGAVLGEVEVRYCSGEIDWPAILGDQVLSSKVLDAVSQVM